MRGGERMDEKKTAPEVEAPGRECEHHYMHCERSWYPAVCCVKCGHTIFTNPDGTVSETYTPVHVKEKENYATRLFANPKVQDNRNFQ